ncbi:hypothetical protein FX988_00959 [Paraglaciecola mesophila]|uniref:Transcriptional antiterminator, Rof n=1 Tax=Paraglaciecola mesophila TaxID=197222 RepID=A0A857JHN3_9ALTE|nr:Rho-binding antiterminator [Paraglaciecola mesophila]QHJ10738.1 hypothetical protein FX988_00959 [Paraglaciecola mesophila]
MKCAEQDYIEIACLYKMPIILTLRHGDNVKGVAKDTVYDKHKRECIVLESSTGELSVALTLIQSMQAQEANPHFSLIHFSQ